MLDGKISITHMVIKGTDLDIWAMALLKESRMVEVCVLHLFEIRLANGIDPTYYAGLLDGKDEWVNFEDVRSMYTST